jgi:uncharacterized membrane protein YozB (DUF420 family)
MCIMMFLILLIPLAILGAVLAWMSWRVRHRQVALVMAAISLVSSILSVAIIMTGLFFYDALQL